MFKKSTNKVKALIAYVCDSDTSITDLERLELTLRNVLVRNNTVSQTPALRRQAQAFHRLISKQIKMRKKMS